MKYEEFLKSKEKTFCQLEWSRLVNYKTNHF